MDILLYFVLLPLIIGNLVAALHQDYEGSISDNHQINGDEDLIESASRDHSAVTSDDCVRLRAGHLAENEDIESCFHIGYKFMRKYIRSTRIKKANGNNKCSLFNRFRLCFLSIYAKCSQNKSLSQAHDKEFRHTDVDAIHSSHSRHDLLEIWRDVIDHVSCLCNPKSECHIDQSCMFTEIDGFWAKRCDDFYKFNVEQKTKHHCHFFEEKIQCKTALVSTACNSDTAEFARNLLYLLSGNDTDRLQCSHRHHKKNHKVFSYTDTCKPHLIQEIDNCSADFTSQNIVEFYKDNDLIPQNTKKILKTACRTIDRFNTCMKPLRNSCEDGVQRVLDYHEDLRRYLLKMNYICSIYPEFKRELKCYQKIVSNGTLKPCSWRQVEPWQRDVTAYQFYCQPTHPNTVNLVKELKVVGQCHDAIFKYHCGETASQHMNDLFNLAFSDPFYLRLSYKPDCSLHHPEPPRTTAPTPSSTNQTLDDLTSSHSPSILSSPRASSNTSEQLSSSPSSASTDDDMRLNNITTPSLQNKTRHLHELVTVLRINDEALRSGSSSRLYNSWRTLILHGLLILFAFFIKL